MSKRHTIDITEENIQKKSRTETPYPVFSVIVVEFCEKKGISQIK